MLRDWLCDTTAEYVDLAIALALKALETVSMLLPEHAKDCCLEIFVSLKCTL